MPFDGTDFHDRPDHGDPRPPSDNAVTIVIVVIATALLLTPFSAAGLVDLVRYLQG